jgi:hypothetical protein
MVGASRLTCGAALAVGLAAACVGAADAGVVPGAGAKVRAAVVAERRALALLPSTAGSHAGYRQAAANVNAALSDLRGAQSRIIAYAGSTGPFPNDAKIEQLLSTALAADNLAATSLDETLLLIAKGAPPFEPAVRQIRVKLKEALAASVPLEKLLS